MTRRIWVIVALVSGLVGGIWVDRAVWKPCPVHPHHRIEWVR